MPACSTCSAWPFRRRRHGRGWWSAWRPTISLRRMTKPKGDPSPRKVSYRSPRSSACWCGCRETPGGTRPRRCPRLSPESRATPRPSPCWSGVVMSAGANSSSTWPPGGRSSFFRAPAGWPTRWLKAAPAPPLTAGQGPLLSATISAPCWPPATCTSSRWMTAPSACAGSWPRCSRRLAGAGCGTGSRCLVYCPDGGSGPAHPSPCSIPTPRAAIRYCGSRSWMPIAWSTPPSQSAT